MLQINPAKYVRLVEGWTQGHAGRVVGRSQRWWSRLELGELAGEGLPAEVIDLLTTRYGATAAADYDTMMRAWMQQKNAADAEACRSARHSA